MNTKQLRRKILDLAIRGKLVPQDPNDEPASVLLERVRAEKELLIKEGKIKRGRNNDVKIKDVGKSRYEQFDIPDSWEWINLSSLVEISTGPFGTMLHKSDYVSDGIPIVNPQNITADGRIVPNKYVSSQTANNLTSYAFRLADVVIGRRGEMGRCAVVTKAENGWLCGTGCFILRSYTNIIDSTFLTIFIRSNHTRDYLSQSSIGATMDNLNHGILKHLLIALPPLSEQSRIVAAIESTFAVIDKIEQNKADLQATVAAAKSKILSLAMRGKLVPQDPNDEPVPLLLKYIHEEREHLTKPNKTKRCKSGYSVVKSCGNHCAAVPLGWFVYTLGELFSVVGGGTPSTNETIYWGTGTPWFSSADIDEFGNVSPRRMVTNIGIENSTTNIAPKGSVVVVTRVGLGKVAMLDSSMCFSQDSQALIPICTKLLYNRFVYYFLFFTMQTLKYSGRGTTISGITKKQLTDICFPLPPLAEQKRIVAAIDAAFEQLDIIAENLS